MGKIIPFPRHRRDQAPIQPDTIWLSPMCEECDRCVVERLWCTEPQDGCPECGLEWVEYVLQAED